MIILHDEPTGSTRDVGRWRPLTGARALAEENAAGRLGCAVI
jgi:hypothetical protein